VIATSEQIRLLDEECKPIGLYRETRPLISELPLEAGLTIIMFTDGIVHAGSRYGEEMDFITCLQAMLEDENPNPQEIADSLLAHALQLDEGRPVDDISVVVVQVTSHTGDNVRRMTVRLPLV
jgi:serine phosphatase RsbU (regulator of sigma subunit)